MYEGGSCFCTLRSSTKVAPHGSLLQHRGRGLRGWEGLLQPQGQRDAVRDGEADPRVVAAHAARAPVRVGRCAHDWGEVAARRCGAVCVVRGRGMPAIVRTWSTRSCWTEGGGGVRCGAAGVHDGLRVLGGPDDPEACAGGARVEVSVACL
ncbi:elongation factor 1-alpha (EF-1-alpha) [Trypanosoma cruzi]|uniref:Elongation factor 1-alpha (EF-1-alpha), putative n=1 Tax=Trypanosoma cruzi (strain CL Brener) TaxID=353153 RepID=Q4D2N6_TRYCC|nr:elongation factor 1-alpha (EF-1-alpha), putative [Trypanosoma cruzi]EAN86795.1 elongation factor 1-alpha (EF-1-alpha), putative [Trypanosoma cruzi]RNC36959.1 elongation factor 1-alpha (EF-1-alpha) [Trypanosoma cruzi]|eukprot:XP_808646.1 elongation factor 1-alpha (EF-1-alpha) [Trypanosoma cruzi strain CL Brener]